MNKLTLSTLVKPENTDRRFALNLRFALKLHYLTYKKEPVEIEYDFNIWDKETYENYIVAWNEYLEKLRKEGEETRHPFLISMVKELWLWELKPLFPEKLGYSFSPAEGGR